jgi:hypothetical protein
MPQLGEFEVHVVPRADFVDQELVLIDLDKLAQCFEKANVIFDVRVMLLICWIQQICRHPVQRLAVDQTE